MVVEAQGQRTHLFGIEHELGGSCELKMIAVRMGQSRARRTMERAHEDPLGRLPLGAVAVARAPIALGQPQLDPIGRAIHGARETPRVDKGLEQKERVAEALLPVAHHPAFGEREHPRADIGPVPVRQDQETTIVGNQLQAVILGAKVPTDPAVTHPTFKGRRRETQLGYPLIPPGRDIPDRLADLREIPEIVMRRHLLPIALLFAALYRADLKRRQHFFQGWR